MSETAVDAVSAARQVAEAVAKYGHRVEAPEATGIYEPPTAAEYLYYIESGQVRVYQVGPDSSAHLADILGPGEWFGTAALARAPAHGARAIAASASVIWTVPPDRLIRLASEQPRIALGLLGQLAERLQAAQEAAARLVFDDCNARLVHTLLRFSRTPAATIQPGGDVALQITHRQLAEAVGAARETISLALTQLRQRQLLRTGRNRVFFNPLALQRFCRRSTQPNP